MSYIMHNKFSKKGEGDKCNKHHEICKMFVVAHLGIMTENDYLSGLLIILMKVQININ